MQNSVGPGLPAAIAWIWGTPNPRGRPCCLPCGDTSDMTPVPRRRAVSSSESDARTPPPAGWWRSLFGGVLSLVAREGFEPRPPGYEPDELPDCSTSRTDNRSSCHRVPQPRLVSCSTNVPYRVGTIGFITPFMSGAADLVPYEPSRWFPQNRSSHLVLPVAPVQWCVSAYGTASPSHVFDGHPVQGGFLVRSATESDASLNANRMP